MTDKANAKQALERLKSFNHFYRLNGGHIGPDYVDDVDTLIALPQAEPPPLEDLRRELLSHYTPGSDPIASEIMQENLCKVIDHLAAQGYLVASENPQNPRDKQACVREDGGKPVEGLADAINHYEPELRKAFKGSNLIEAARRYLEMTGGE